MLFLPPVDYVRASAGTGIHPISHKDWKPGIVLPPPPPEPEPLRFDFTISAPVGPIPHTVTYGLQLSGTVVGDEEFDWDFQGNDTWGDSSQRNPTYTYNFANTWSPQVRVRRPGGQWSAPLKKLHAVTAQPTSNPVTLTPSFIVSPSTIVAGQSVTVTDTSTASGTTITARSWDATNDGVEDATGTSATFTFTAAGTQTIALTITGANAATAKTTRAVTVTPAAYVGSAAISGPPRGQNGVASSAFTVTLDGAPSGTVSFTPAASIAGTFSPAVLTFNSSTLTRTFTFTPGAVGTASITLTNDGGWTNPPAITYSSEAVAPSTYIDITAANKWFKRIDPERPFASTQYYGPTPTTPPGSPSSLGNRARFNLEFPWTKDKQTPGSPTPVIGDVTTEPYQLDMQRTSDPNGKTTYTPGAPAYSADTTYAIGNLVLQDGTTYYCKAPTTGNAPPNATYWQPLATGDSLSISTASGSPGTADQRLIILREAPNAANGNRACFLYRIDKVGTGWRNPTDTKYHNEVKYLGEGSTLWDVETIIVWAVRIPAAMKSYGTDNSITVAQLHGKNTYATATTPWFTAPFVPGGSDPTKSTLTFILRGVVGYTAGAELARYPITNPAADEWHWIIAHCKPGHGYTGGREIINDYEWLTTGSGNMPFFHLYHAVGDAPPTRVITRGEPGVKAGPWGYPNRRSVKPGAAQPTAADLEKAHVEHAGQYWIKSTNEFQAGRGVTRVESRNVGIWVYRVGDIAGAGVWDALQSVRRTTVVDPPPPDNPPGQPGTITISNVTGSSFDWDVADVSGATSYETQLHWYVDSNDGGGLNWYSPEPANGGTSATSGGTVSGLEAGMILAFRVRARNAAGAGPWREHTTFVATTFPTIVHKDTMAGLTTTTTRLTATDGQVIENRRFTGAGGVRGIGDIAVTIRNCVFDTCLVQNNDGNDSPLYFSGNASAAKVLLIEDCHFYGSENPIKIMGADQTNLTAGRKVIIRRCRWSNMKWPAGKGFPLAQIALPHMLIDGTKTVDIYHNIFDGWGDGYTATTAEGDTINNYQACVRDMGLRIRLNLYRGGSYKSNASATAGNTSTLFNIADGNKPESSTTQVTGSALIEHNRVVYHASAAYTKFGGDGQTLIRGNWCQSDTPKTNYQTGNGFTLFQQYRIPIRNTRIERNRMDWRDWGWGGPGNPETSIDFNPASLATANPIGVGNLKNQAGRRLTAQQLWEAGTGLTWGALPF